MLYILKSNIKQKNYKAIFLLIIYKCVTLACIFLKKRKDYEKE